MGKTLYNRLKDMLKTWHKDTINLEELKMSIIKNIGAQQRTIKQAMDIMIKTDLIQDINNSRFLIHGR